MAHPYGLGAAAPDDRPETFLPVDEPPAEPLEHQLAGERDTEPRFVAPLEVAQESRSESLRHEAQAVPDGGSRASSPARTPGQSEDRTE